MMMIRAVTHSLVLVTLACLMVGCNRSPDCTDALAEAHSLGERGELAAFDEAQFDVACRGDYLAAWEASKNTYCEPMLAFDRAMQGENLAPACEAPAYRRNFQLGANLYALIEERSAVEAMLTNSENEVANPVALQQARMRLRVLEREIPELETLARMRGLMGPAELPPEVRDGG